MLKNYTYNLDNNNCFFYKGSKGVHVKILIKHSSLCLLLLLLFDIASFNDSALVLDINIILYKSKLYFILI